MLYVVSTTKEVLRKRSYYGKVNNSQEQASGPRATSFRTIYPILYLPVYLVYQDIYLSRVEYRGE